MEGRNLIVHDQRHYVVEWDLPSPPPSMNANIYINEVLDTYVKLFRGAISNPKASS